ELLRKFKRMIFISDMDWLEGASIAYHDFEGMLGMEAQQNFLNPLSAVLKRMMDILIAGTAGLVSLPLILLAAVLIKLDSSGSVLYKQERVGKDGKRIKIYKFRSMREDGERVMAEYLAGNASAQDEWAETQKLKEDPRITRVGKWVRKFSVDELPQLYNILKGDMSVVGPRPILVEQKKLYGEGLEVYTSVRPGLTGFWQVSGRNRTSFCQRAIYDVYYVRNWSVWLDTYILLRTIWVVLSRDGAY
ncbi:MAG TPA: exopolysaccharide biosynthesis polyprenyl glycosylphosphotransferase, partial [Anaerolineales bacterium]|nr:exopolysaccharide biosynthesis polyprenyl glycosylphosphotransferase [Anaerolineales bacterium]